MTQTQTFVISLLAVLLPVVIPAMVNLIFVAQKTKLEKAKLYTEQHKELIADLVKTAQQAYSDWNGQERYQWVLMKASQKLHLPESELKTLIESTLADLKKSFADNWDKLGSEHNPKP